jgi:hypothetical protein
MSKLDAFIAENRADMLADLTDIVANLKQTIASDPAEYTEHGDDTASIDIRLCIDLGERRHGWIFRTGLADYDQSHSEYCAASCVTIRTCVPKLLDELVNQLEE